MTSKIYFPIRTRAGKLKTHIKSGFLMRRNLTVEEFINFDLDSSLTIKTTSGGAYAPVLDFDKKLIQGMAGDAKIPVIISCQTHTNGAQYAVIRIDNIFFSEQK